MYRSKYQVGDQIEYDFGKTKLTLRVELVRPHYDYNFAGPFQFNTYDVCIVELDKTVISVSERTLDRGVLINADRHESNDQS